NTEDYFNAVLDGLNGIEDEASKSDLAKRLLGSSDMKNLIDGGSEAIKNQKKELEGLGVLVSNQDYKESVEFNDTLLLTTTMLKGLANKVMTSIMPLFAKLMKQFNSFIKANKELISSGLKTFLDAIINGSQFFLSLVGRIIEHLGGMQTVIAVIAGLLIIWQLPLIATIAAGFALMLIFDDIMNFFKGNDSVIGDWVDSIKASFEELKTNFPNLGAILQIQIDSFMSIFNYFKDTLFNLWDLITGKISFEETLNNQVNIIYSFIDSIKAVFSDLITWISDIFSNLDIFGGLKDQIKELKDSMTDFIPDMPSMSDISSFMGFSDAPTPEPALAQASPSMQAVDSSNKTTNTYNISASVDANSKSIDQALREISNPSGYN
ncbi:MAG: hypothetical protein PF437_04280, partial [Sulfurimonas sp.]|nr:hypothetical protein [Sulfurimonas sp.]